MGAVGRTVIADRAGHRLLFAASSIHLLNDACFALLYPLLPAIATEFHLSYAQVGTLKAAFSGASSVLQIPAGLLGERLGEYLVLLLGNTWVGLGLGAMALAGSYAALLALSVLAGIGGNAQHPLATSLVSRSAASARMSTALGTLNFAGDLGKLLGPLVAGLLVIRLGWRAPFLGVGSVTAVFSAILLWQRGLITAPPSRPPVPRSPAVRKAGQGGMVVLLLVASSLDSMTRGAALTFLPFLLVRHGWSTGAVSALFALIFAAGAAGKFACGWLGDHWGVIATIVATELLTAGTLIAYLPASIPVDVVLAVAFGFGLNGTSSALLAVVARLVPTHRRTRGYGTYFTVTLVSSALAPLAYGVLGDHAGLPVVFAVMAVLTAVVPVLVLPLRRAFD